MPKQGTDEQFPLLLVLVGDQDLSQNNKRLFGRGRFDGITSGASAIITEWPNYLSSCWLTALICGIVLFTVSIFFSSCMPIQQHPRLPRCSPDSQLIANKTIHLVHTFHKWHPLQLQLLENISANFPDYKINLIVVSNKNWTKTRNETKFNETKTNTSDSLFADIQKKPNVVIVQKTYRQAFENSPLFLTWASLNHQMRIFAIRLLQVWQWGGLSFDIPDHKIGRRLKNATNFAELKVRSLVKTGHDRYKKLRSDVVSVDFNGWHMETKMPCHAFFGKVLMKLRKCNEKTTPKDVLTGPMWAYCRAGVIDTDFCHFKSILL